MKCAQCECDLGGYESRLAFIVYLGRGDTYVSSYWFCARCQVYTIESVRDRFSGGSGAAVYPPVSKEVGDRDVAMIRRCPAPNDKHCSCEAHDHFG